MFIHEAVKRAVEENKEIYRTSAKHDCSDVYATIRPTNSYDTCLLVINKDNEKKSCRAWNPTANDLAADDWELVME